MGGSGRVAPVGQPAAPPVLVKASPRTSAPRDRAAASAAAAAAAEGDADDGSDSAAAPPTALRAHTIVRWHAYQLLHSVALGAAFSVIAVGALLVILVIKFYVYGYGWPQAWRPDEPNCADTPLENQVDLLLGAFFLLAFFHMWIIPITFLLSHRRVALIQVKIAAFAMFAFTAACIAIKVGAWSEPNPAEFTILFFAAQTAPVVGCRLDPRKMWLRLLKRLLNSCVLMAYAGLLLPTMYLSQKLGGVVEIVFAGIVIPGTHMFIRFFGRILTSGTISRMHKRDFIIFNSIFCRDSVVPGVITSTFNVLAISGNSAFLTGCALQILTETCGHLFYLHVAPRIRRAVSLRSKSSHLSSGMTCESDDSQRRILMATILKAEMKGESTGIAGAGILAVWLFGVEKYWWRALLVLIAEGVADTTRGLLALRYGVNWYGLKGERSLVSMLSVFVNGFILVFLLLKFECFWL